ncbi:hypothetical protein AgCh_009240 [Apium graveolens]
MADHRDKNGPWLSVPQFGDWDLKGQVPDYSMDFSKIREMRKQNKRDVSRASLGNEEELISSTTKPSSGHQTIHYNYNQDHSPTDFLRYIEIGFTLTAPPTISGDQLPTHTSYSSLTGDIEMRRFFTEIGYETYLKNLGQLNRNGLRKECNFFFDCITKAFNNKSSNFDALPIMTQQIVTKRRRLVKAYYNQHLFKLKQEIDEEKQSASNLNSDIQYTAEALVELCETPVMQYHKRAREVSHEKVEASVKRLQGKGFFPGSSTQEPLSQRVHQLHFLIQYHKNLHLKCGATDIEAQEPLIETAQESITAIVEKSTQEPGCQNHPGTPDSPATQEPLHQSCNAILTPAALILIIDVEGRVHLSQMSTDILTVPQLNVRTKFE